MRTSSTHIFDSDRGNGPLQYVRWKPTSSAEVLQRFVSYDNEHIANLVALIFHSVGPKR